MPDLIEHKYLVTFLIKRVREHSLFSAAKRAITYSRRFFLIGRIIKYLGIAVAVIEASAALIFITAVTLVLIPIILLAIVGFTVSDRIIGTHILASVAFAKYLERDRIYVISEAGTFGEGFAKELAEAGAAVFVITGDPSRRFICARMQNGVFYIRHAFYFRLKRKRLSALSHKLTYLL